MAKKVSKRIIYDQNYYRFQAMLRDAWFKNEISWIKKRFSEINCPVPPKGFKNIKQYEDWQEKYWEKRSMMINSPEYLSRVKEITAGKTKISSEEYDKLDKFKEGYLPPVYGENIRNILEHFGFSPSKMNFREFIESCIFFNKKEYYEPIVQVKAARNQKTQEIELFVRIFKYTKKEDIVKNWHFISEVQNKMPEYLGKSKKWVELDRDLEIYNLYKELKKKHKREKYFARDREIFVQLHKKYKSLNTTKIRNILFRAAKRLGETTP